MMDVALWSRVPTCILLISCGVPQLAMSELTITVTGLPDEQVSLSPLTTLDIQDAERLAGPQRRLLPFVVTVKNESERDIIAYHVRWTCTDGQAKTTASNSSIYSFGNPAGPRAVLAKGRSAAVLGGLWDGPTAGGLLRGITAELVQGLLLYFERQRTVSVTLEAVL